MNIEDLTTAVLKPVLEKFDKLIYAVNRCADALEEANRDGK